MQSATLLILLAGLVAVSLAQDATMCYVCSGESCADEYEVSDSDLTDCSTATGATDDGGCYKSKSTEGNVNTVTRGCAGKTLGYTDESCTKGTKSGSAQVLTCYCEGSKCNGGSHLAASLSVLVAVTAKYLL